ncbi:MAG TPA: hypothetical protein VGE18_01245 [Candidatus Paceibacterota bacterium]
MEQPIKHTELTDKDQMRERFDDLQLMLLTETSQEKKAELQKESDELEAKLQDELVA